ncbi:MAG: CPBP family intramembrane metalloprotease [Clostridiales bacterium]|nr:CPBP family intramembrane metalloprotease [Clostridiales bacterium]
MKRALIIIQGLLMMVLAVFIVSFLYTLITYLFMYVTGLSVLSSDIEYCLMVMAIMISCILLYVWYKKYMSHRRGELIDLKEVFSIKNVLLYLMLGIGCQLFISGVLSLLRPLFERVFSYYDETMTLIFDADIIIVAAYVIVFAPLFEEFLMRGILYNRLRYGISFPLANFIQALAFGIYHLDIVQGIYAFAIGLILGYLYEKTRTLLAPIFLHMVINGLGFLIQLLALGKYLTIGVAIIVGGILLFGSLYMYGKNNKYIIKK